MPAWSGGSEYGFTVVWLRLLVCRAYHIYAARCANMEEALKENNASE